MHNIHDFLQAFYQSTGIPVTHYENSVPVQVFPEKSFFPNPAWILLKKSFHESNPAAPFCIITAELLQCGYIPLITPAGDAGNSFLVLGPSIQQKCDEPIALQILTSIQEPFALAPQLSSYLNRHIVSDYKQFIAATRMLSMIFSDTAQVKTQNFFSVTSKRSFGRGISTQYLPLNRKDSELTMRYVEDSILDNIRRGNPREVLDIILKLPEMSLPTGQMAETSLRSFKNIIINSSALCRHYAIQGGLSSLIANSLCEQYAMRVESLNSYQELELLLAQMMVDFARHTKEVQNVEAESPLIILIKNEVNSLLYEKISVKLLAHRLSYSPEHLCRQFHRETGMKLNEYIQQQKIKEAQRLLLYTDMTLLEISSSLQFSSQSYFQSVFKKICGTTPKQYRQNHS